MKKEIPPFVLYRQTVNKASVSTLVESSRIYECDVSQISRVRYSLFLSKLSNLFFFAITKGRAPLK